MVSVVPSGWFKINVLELLAAPTEQAFLISVVMVCARNL